MSLMSRRYSTHHAQNHHSAFRRRPSLPYLELATCIESQTVPHTLIQLDRKVGRTDAVTNGPDLGQSPRDTWTSQRHISLGEYCIFAVSLRQRPIRSPKRLTETAPFSSPPHT
jgi:hypothetical protein